VFVTVEATCTKEFWTYTHRLVATQDLDHIVFNEVHLTVTAFNYRQAMVDLALIYNIYTQFVYLTAILLLTMQAMFEEQNNLVAPKVIWASTNRRNLFYIARRAARLGSLLEESAQKARDAWQASGLFDHT
jgi:hypothetical protein